MKNLEGKTITKKIIAMFLVIVTILSTFPLSVFVGALRLGFAGAGSVREIL